MGGEPQIPFGNDKGKEAENIQLAGAPAEYALPAVRPTLAEAQAWCRALASSHYENFHVATWFLPKRIRPYFESIYAFSRVADDLGDEVADTATATRLLGEWRAMLYECYGAPGESRHPVFVGSGANHWRDGRAAWAVRRSDPGLRNGPGEDVVWVAGGARGVLAAFREPGGAAGALGFRV